MILNHSKVTLIAHDMTIFSFYLLLILTKNNNIQYY